MLGRGGGTAAGGAVIVEGTQNPMAGLVRGGIVMLLALVVASGAALGGLRGLVPHGPRSGVLGVVDVRSEIDPLTPMANAAALGPLPDTTPMPDPLPTPVPDPAPPPMPVVLLASTAVWIDPDVALETWITAHPTPTSAPTPVPLPTPDLAVAPRLAARDAAPLVSSGPRDRPRVAITIDDTFRPASIRADFGFFMRERVNVTWFPIGVTLAGNAAIWREIADAGFPIANHTWSHSDLTRLTQAQIEWEINTQAAAVERITGRPGVPLLRPMGGSWNGNVLRAAGATGQAAVVLWDATSGDTGRGPVEEVIANAMRARNGSIVLFHANQERSDIAIQQVVHDLRAKGFELVTLGQLLGLPGPVPFPPVAPPADPATTAAPTPAPTPAPIPTPIPMPAPVRVAAARLSRSRRPRARG